MVLLDNCACPRIEVYTKSGRKDQLTPHEVYGTYSRRAEKVNGRPFYTSDGYGGSYGIWWYQGFADQTHPKYQWQIGKTSNKGKCLKREANLQDVNCPQNLKHWSWMVVDYHKHAELWYQHGYDLGVRCFLDDDLKDHVQSHANNEIPKIVNLLASEP